MQIIACTTEQCVRGKCSKQTDRIGYESSEQLDVSNRLELLSAFDTEVQSVVDMTCETPCLWQGRTYVLGR